MPNFALLNFVFYLQYSGYASTPGSPQCLRRTAALRTCWAPAWQRNRSCHKRSVRKRCWTLLSALAPKLTTPFWYAHTGGGLRGYYVCGASVVLAALCQSLDLKIRRLSGASAGAWNAVFIACGVHPLDWAESYYESMHRSGDAPPRTTCNALK